MTAVSGQHGSSTESPSPSPILWPSPPHNRSVSSVPSSPLGAPWREPAWSAIEPDAESRFASGFYRQIETVLDRKNKTFWCYLQPHDVPSFTHGVLAELADMQRSIMRMFDDAAPDSEP